jgi:hypothetical protein
MPLPIVCVQEDTFSPADAVVLKLQQSRTQSVSATLYQEDGSAYEIPASATVDLTLKESWTSLSSTLSASCVVDNYTDGDIHVDFTVADTTVPGIWLGEFTVKDTADIVVRRFYCYSEVVGGLTEIQSNNPLTISEIRLAIRDRCSADNYLLDRVEFSDAEIIYAIKRPVDWWNSTVPDGFARYSYSTFPYRYHWMDAVIGELLRIAALNLSRNRLAIQGGGLNTDDKARAELYLQLSEKFQQQFKTWALGKIRTINMTKWYGYTVNRSFGSN